MKITPSMLLNIISLAILVTSVFFMNTTANTSELKNDPWEDVNGDGRIDLYDAVSLLNSYGSGGDVTKNASVTNLSTQQSSWKLLTVVENLNVTWDTGLRARPVRIWGDPVDVGSVSIGGYDQMRLYMNVMNWTPVGGSFPDEINEAKVRVNVYAKFGEGENHILSFESEVWNSETASNQVLLGLYPSDGMRETLEPAIRIEVQGSSRTPYNVNRPSTISCLITVGIYLRND